MRYHCACFLLLRTINLTQLFSKSDNEIFEGYIFPYILPMISVIPRSVITLFVINSLSLFQKKMTGSSSKSQTNLFFKPRPKCYLENMKNSLLLYLLVNDISIYPVLTKVMF